MPANRHGRFFLNPTRVRDDGGRSRLEPGEVVVAERVHQLHAVGGERRRRDARRLEASPGPRMHDERHGARASDRPQSVDDGAQHLGQVDVLGPMQRGDDVP